MKKEPKLFLVSAPSGAGKSSLIDAVLASANQSDLALELSISYTTRSPRKGESNGSQYFFISKKNFLDKKNSHFFLEDAEVHGNLYGTSVEFVESKLNAGVNEDVHFRNHKFKRGDQVALVIGAAGRDEKIWNSAHSFNPFRSTKKNLSFGSGIHFCVGAPLARLELVTALPIIFDKFPNIKLLDEPLYSNLYHFHGLRELNVSLNN